MRYTFKEQLRTRLINALNIYCYNLRNQEEYNHALRHKITVDTNCTKEQQRQALLASGILDPLQKSEIAQIEQIINNLLSSLKTEVDSILLLEAQDSNNRE